MSGGVDSSVAAALMLNAGYDCIGVTLKLYASDDIVSIHRGGCSGTPTRGCCSLEDVNDARNVAFALNMPHYVLNFTESFRDEVIRRFIDIYEKGGTPNPCIDCNRYIKFERLLYRAQQLDFDLLVTGHYAQIEKDEASGRWLLKKAADAKKDQSYVLYCLTQEQLARTRFPLGNITKGRAREIAEEQGFINAKKQDSQDICFVPDGDYGRFMERWTGKRYPEGNIIDLGGKVLGKHRGIVRYTIGQRRGLGIAMNEPVYVEAKSAADNTITLGPNNSLYSKTFTADTLNLIACDRIESPLRVKVKTRYQQQEQWATAEQIGGDTLRVEFDEPQRAITPGQAAVLYDGDIVVGGGTITGTE
ncbi:tRNA-specific 2-thiouridylase MnmA [Spirochaetia bacterium]|nr:tRNA-specific 2-thiouridylase MnmA [Spirochaetia bacterium]